MRSTAWGVQKRLVRRLPGSGKQVVEAEWRRVDREEREARRVGVALTWITTRGSGELEVEGERVPAPVGRPVTVPPNAPCRMVPALPDGMTGILTYHPPEAEVAEEPVEEGATVA